MAIDLASQFNFTSALPLDGRLQVADLTARDALAAGVRWRGLQTFVVSNSRTYMLVAGITNSDWVDTTRMQASVISGLTAFAGGGQASALSLTRYINRVTTVATAGDSVKLPAAVAGTEVVVIHDGVASVDIFPQTGESIDALAVNIAYALTPTSKNVRFICPATGLWKSAAGGGGGSATTFGSRASPRSVVAATGIVSGSSHMSTTDTEQNIFVIGSIAGESDISANPQIQAGTIVGQKMTLIGRDNDNYIKLENGTGLDLAGLDPWYSFVGNLLDLKWDGTNWFETQRRG